MEKIKSHFVFNRQQRNGILSLIIIISGLLLVYYFVDFSEGDTLEISSEEIQIITYELDSLRAIEIAFRKPKKYPFNPNFISDFKGYTLGMSSDEIDRLKKFRAKNKWINSVKDFKRVTKVSDSLLKEISPYFKFPDWIDQPKAKKKYDPNTFKEKLFEQKIDLNIATEKELQNIRGIGKTLSKRIILYRKKLGGFTADSQLYEVYGLDNKIVQRALFEFTVKTPREIKKMDLNKISASDIATIPGISFEMAKKIWEYRVLREGINDFSELMKIEGMTQRKLTGIQLYLTLQ